MSGERNSEQAARIEALRAEISSKSKRSTGMPNKTYKMDPAFPREDMACTKIKATSVLASLKCCERQNLTSFVSPVRERAKRRVYRAPELGAAVAAATVLNTAQYICSQNCAHSNYT
jgi:hypothetical protein